MKFKGSAMVALASSKEEVLEVLKADIYAKNEVWDFSKVNDEILDVLDFKKGADDLVYRSRFTLTSVLSGILEELLIGMS